MDRLNKILEERQKEYGPPLQNHERIAEAWQALLRASNGNDSITVTASDVAMLMLALKMVRAAQPTPTSQDTWDDAKNYLSFAEDFSRNRKIPG